MTRSDTDLAPELLARPDATAVSVLGAGALGTALAQAFLRAGHPVTVWNRTAGKADALVAHGATRATAPESAVAASSIVIVCVSTYDDVRATLDLAAGELAGRTLVNLGSGTPGQARAMATWVGEHGAAYLDGAAMSGTRLVGQPDALFLYSGDPAAFAVSEATLASLGRALDLGADPGAASLYDTALLAMNMGVLGGFYQGVALVGAAGVDAPAFASIATGYLPFVTGLLADHARQIQQRRYPGDDGTLEVMAAALNHVAETSRDLGVSVDLPAALEALVRRAVAAGHGHDGIARLADVMGAR